VDYLSKTEFTIPGKSAILNQQGLWGTSVGGKETLTSSQPLPMKYPSQLQKKGRESNISIKDK
jgi:argininosuccinate synthase